ncbi:acyltransferase [Rhodococcus artemisiae]|uniref:Acyltransferase n=1 Tax=Rhodococcus artemisiae TaxID=714159 RepID=A0ABU7LBS1_9NOCA|nr:acyltransferase [Rhodococcus artemisiae]MEE2058991.1 acyltransferase [Rhodococcus artemisiae]
MTLRGWLANGPAASALLHPKLRLSLLRSAGAKIGRARIMHGTTIGGDISGLTIGDGTFLNTGCSLHPTGGITIGNNVSFGPRVVIMTGTHDIGPGAKRASDPTRFQPVTIADGSWLGAGVLVNPGVTIGAGCVVAPGAVVTKDCEPNGLYAGVPAIRKRDLEP